MTKEYLLSKTLYGVDIMNHIIRKEFPDFNMQVKGDNCGENPDPVYAGGEMIQIIVEKTYTPGKKVPNRKARYHFLGESLPDGDAIVQYYHLLDKCRSIVISKHSLDIFS